MKKLGIFLIGAALFLLSGAAFVFSPPVYAIEDPLNRSCAGVQSANSEFCQNVNQGGGPIVFGSNSLLVNIAQTIVFITAAISVVMIVIGGFRYVVSNGDSNAMGSAKNTILYAIVGLVIAMVAQLIVTFVLTRFIT